MKKIYSTIAVLAISSLALFSSCKKDDGDPTPATPVTPDVSVELNQLTKPTSSTNLYVKRDQSSALLQVSAVSTTGKDMSRVYVFKKSTTTTNVGAYTTVEGAGFKKDANDRFYYDIPSDQKNNTVITLSVALNAGNVNAVTDEYYFVFTTGSAYAGAPNIAGVQVGPAQIFINYGILTETTGHRINNFQGPNSGAFDLITLTNKSNLDPISAKDMVDNDDATANWDKSFKAANETKYLKLLSFDYANATDISIKNAYDADNASTTVSSVAAGDVYVAKLRNTESYVLIKVTSISDESGPIGTGNNNEFMQFSVKK